MPLLGGWFRFATIEDADQLWREDLEAGERTLLGPVIDAFPPVIPIAGAKNLQDGRFRMI